MHKRTSGKCIFLKHMKKHVLLKGQAHDGIQLKKEQNIEMKTDNCE